jgi:hypothetical protein
VNGSINQCNATCDLPLGIQTTSLGTSAAYVCSTCASPSFVNRADSECITSCNYVNTTSVDSTSITICETPSDATYCPDFTYLNSTAFTCQFGCSTFFYGSQCYTACPAGEPLVASAGALECQNSCPNSIYIVNGSINQCNATCDLPLGIQTTSLGTSAAYICSTCASPSFVNRADS